MLRATAVAVSILTFCSFTTLAFGFSAGPPDLKTGAPGEGTCADCHVNLNVGTGYVSASGPATFLPGDTLDIFVEVALDGQQRWGFEITALDAANQPVGSLIAEDALRTQLSTDPGTGRQYVKHTSAGTDPGVPDVSPGWTVRWASPADPIESVTFYVAGNAANNNAFSSGDFIYTDVLHFDNTQTAISVEPVTWGRIKALYR